MNIRSSTKTIAGRASYGLIVLLFAMFPDGKPAQAASASSAVPVRGKIVSVNGPDVVVASANGDVKMKVGDKTTVIGEVRIKISDLTSGMYIGTTATKQPDGNFLASEVHVLSEDQRGLSDGHHPLRSAPNSGATMTNGNLERVENASVQNLDGRSITVKYHDGETKVLVPPNIPITKRVPGNRSLLKPGVEISGRAERTPDGTLAADEITVRAPRK